MSAQQKQGNKDHRLVILYERYDGKSERSMIRTAVIPIEDDYSGSDTASAEMAILDIADAGGFWLSSSIFIPYHHVKEIRYEKTVRNQSQHSRQPRRNTHRSGSTNASTTSTTTSEPSPKQTNGQGEQDA